MECKLRSLTSYCNNKRGWKLSMTSVHASLQECKNVAFGEKKHLIHSHHYAVSDSLQFVWLLAMVANLTCKLKYYRQKPELNSIYLLKWMPFLGDSSLSDLILMHLLYLLRGFESCRHFWNQINCWIDIAICRISPMKEIIVWSRKQSHVR